MLASVSPTGPLLANQIIPEVYGVVAPLPAGLGLSRVAIPALNPGLKRYQTPTGPEFQPETRSLERPLGT